MTSTLLLLAPLLITACMGAAAIGGAMTARHYRHHTNYKPTVPLMLLVPIGPALFVLLLPWAPPLLTVCGLLLGGSAGAGAGGYVRSRWAADFGVGEIGAMQREREGITDWLRNRSTPNWRAELVQETATSLIDDEGQRCVLGPEIRRRDQQPTGRLASVRLGQMTPGSGGNSGIVGLILGAPESGKTTTAIRILWGTAAAYPQGSQIIFDPKGDSALRECAQGIARTYGTEFWEWTRETPIDPLGNTIEDPDLDLYAVVSRLMAAMEFNEPYFEGIAQASYTEGAALLRSLGIPLSLNSLAEILSQRGARKILNEQVVAAKAGTVDRATVEEFSDWFKGQEKRWDLLEGAASRVRKLAQTGLGVQFAAAADGGRLISDMAARPGVAYIHLDAGMWPDAARQVSELLSVAIMQDVGEIAQRTGQPVTLFIDELNAIPAERLDAMLMRGRSAGFSLILASQTLGAIGADTPALTAQITGTLSWLVSHRALGQSEGGEDDAERVGRLGGTRIEREITRQTSAGPIALPTGAGSERQVDAYIAHPNTTRSLPKGQAIVIDVSQPTSSDLRSMLCGVTRYDAPPVELRAPNQGGRPQLQLEPGPPLVPEIPYPQAG